MKTKNILKSIIKKTLPYKIYLKRQNKKYSERITYHKRYFDAENKDMLQAYCNALNKAGVKFWLEFGTLLGYYREHGFIAHDMDVDTGTYFENAAIVQKSLENAGFKLVREYKVWGDGGMEQCYLYKHITIDVFYFRKDDNKMYCNSFYVLDNVSIAVNKPIPFGVKRIEVPLMDYVPAKFYDCDVFVPEETDRYLRVHYGDDYMTPNPNYDNKKDSTNIIWYDYNKKPGVALLKLPYFGHPEDYGLI